MWGNNIRKYKYIFHSASFTSLKFKLFRLFDSQIICLFLAGRFFLICVSVSISAEIMEICYFFANILVICYQCNLYYFVIHFEQDRRLISWHEVRISS